MVISTSYNFRICGDFSALLMIGQNLVLNFMFLERLELYFTWIEQVVKKTFIGEGEVKKPPNQMAGEILSFFTRNNFAVSDRGEIIT